MTAQNNELGKNIGMKCQNPICDNETNSKHSRFCRKCSLRWNARRLGYTLQEQELDLGDSIGFVLKRSDLK